MTPPTQRSRGAATAALLATVALLAACGPARTASTSGAPRAAHTAAGTLGALGAPCGGGLAADAWADCTLRTLSLREKAAQMVWPQLYG
ncbi:MAG TPA: hypothetical protein VNA89_09175, partial [Gemmatimonadaceae bacterium]|nr:hypothetical protein [Gemmatimonadaceae bacterium]